MPSITIRDVPAEVRDQLAAQAAAEGRSMQQYLVKELTRLAARPDTEALLDRMRERARSANLSITSAEILESLREDRDR